MKASELIKKLQETIAEYGDKDIMICQSDNCGGEVWATNVSVTTQTGNKEGYNTIIIEEVI